MENYFMWKNKNIKYSIIIKLFKICIRICEGNKNESNSSITTIDLRERYFLLKTSFNLWFIDMWFQIL